MRGAAPADAAAEAGAAGAEEPAAASVPAALGGWAASYLEQSQKRRKVMLDDEDGDESSSDSGAGEETLTQAILDRTFKDLTDSVRCARIAGPRVAEHFIVKVRGARRTRGSLGIGWIMRAPHSSVPRLRHGARSTSPQRPNIST